MNKKTTEEFIEESKEKHGDKYDYSEVEYIKIKLKVKIICKEHGIFEQKAQHHLRGVGCPKCANESRATKLRFTTEKFIEKAVETHGDKYKYSEVEYKGSNTKVKIFCDIHGQFLQSPDAHLSGNGCIKCGKTNMADKRTKTAEQFVYEANLVHDGRYLYDQVKYKKGVEKIDILCTIHGIFKQTPNNHIKGQGCPKCSNDSCWRRSEYIKKANGRTCTFYTLRCFNENEKFYKVGITMRTIEGRYPSTKLMPYEYEVISEVKGSAGFIWDLELAEKRKLKEFSYQPILQFKGSKTECFTQYNIGNA